IPTAMRQWLRLRDGKCPFPGCTNQSLDNDADHLLAWANGGTTGITNLGQPCRKHHRLKHTTTWKPTPATKNEPPGWTSPTGRHYQNEHPDWEPPTWPDQIPDDTHFGATVQSGAILEDLPRDPFPEHNVVHFPLAEDDLPDYVLFPDDSLPGRPLPQDPFPTWEAHDGAAENWSALTTVGRTAEL
ncbi:HNH endonuclease signature motif containing protein, partial [Pseudarthrobacter sp. TAF60_1]|uniref:HNH endonuclease signature motif containing protein n=1 Tax=Pseudarthrobacter sp. TAF60_1 TaxID=3233071 RepID=UPI003F9E270E